MPVNFNGNQVNGLTDLLPSVDTHLLINTDLSYGLVIREVNIARDIEVIQFELAKAIAQPNSTGQYIIASK